VLSRCCEVYAAHLKTLAANRPTTLTTAQLRTNIHFAAKEAAPMNSTVQALRERTAEIVAESAAVIRAAEQLVATRRRLRDAEGKRNSAVDQQTIQDLHDSMHTAHDSLVALGADCDSDSKSTARGASMFRLAADRGAVPDAPDTYATANTRRTEIRAAQTPDLTEGYSTRGLPPDSYRQAIALKTALAAKSDVADPTQTVMHESGAPDGYATALKVKATHAH
jgi:hypothetical protein